MSAESLFAGKISTILNRDRATFVAQEPINPDDQSPGADPALDSLDRRLEAARRAEDERLAREHAPMADQARSMGMQVASTMVGYPLGGIVIGWGLDEVFGTRPWIMITLMFLAFAGACLQVVRSNQAQQRQAGDQDRDS